MAELSTSKERGVEKRGGKKRGREWERRGLVPPTTCLHDACGLYNIVMPSCSHSRLIICHVIIIIII